MTTTETTSTSWFSRIGSSLKNIFVGILFIIGGAILLFWNEGRAVRTEQGLQEGLSVVISVPSGTFNEKNEAKLIHFSGKTVVPGILTDGDFGVSGSAVKMRRISEVYQWKEKASSRTVKKLGGGTETTTTYSYSKDWSDKIINSSIFKESESHQNPTSKAFVNKEWIAQGVSVGSYTISEDMIQSISGYQPFAITQDMLTTQTSSMSAGLQLIGNTIYYQTKDTTAPEIGNTRIYYEIVAPQDISVIYKQSGKILVPYVTKNGEKISMIQLGNLSAAEMFKNAEESNKTMTWVLRLVGALLLFIGFQMILGVFQVIGDVVPFIGNIIGAGAGIASFLLSLIIGSTVIAVAWITYRPLIGVTLFLIAAGGYVLLIKKPKKT